MFTINVPGFLSSLMDMWTKGHHSRVALYSKKIAGSICPHLINQTVLAASVHDIGKIAIPEKILLKPVSLTRSEMELVRLHPQFGALILQRNIVGMIDEEVISAVMHHHERWDGLGYPHGLRGRDIPLMARILAVADAFDAMTSFRPYRTSLSMQEALVEISKHSGVQFDPEITDVFLHIMRGGEKTAGGGKFYDFTNMGGVAGIMIDLFEQIKSFAAERKVKEIFAVMAETEEPAIREEAYVQAVRLGGPEVVECFIALLSSPEAYLRNLAVEALQELGTGYISRLEELLYDPDPDLRILGFNIFAGIRNEEAAKPVRRFLERLISGEVEVQENVAAAAIEFLVGLGSPDDAELLDRVAVAVAGRGDYPYLCCILKLLRKNLCPA
ncbi:MAG: HD domain-containing protein [Thermoanaerobacteraceae bacterium]|nr:HD domain-containing protein [Thermoanaerobacteraceae bacterium]